MEAGDEAFYRNSEIQAICLSFSVLEAFDCSICMCVPLPVADSWSEWSEWSDCDSSGAQFRVRQCIILFPVGSQCTGNTTESRACALDSNFIPGEISLLLEGLVKSLSVSGAKCSTVPDCTVHRARTELAFCQEKCVSLLCRAHVAGSGLYMKICLMAPSAVVLSLLSAPGTWVSHCHSILQVPTHCLVAGCSNDFRQLGKNSLLFTLSGFETLQLLEEHSFRLCSLHMQTLVLW